MKIYSCLVYARVPAGNLPLGKVHVRATNAEEACRLAGDLMGREFAPEDVQVEFDPMDDPEEVL